MKFSYVFLIIYKVCAQLFFHYMITPFILDTAHTALAGPGGVLEARQRYQVLAAVPEGACPAVTAAQ